MAIAVFGTTAAMHQLIQTKMNTKKLPKKAAFMLVELVIAAGILAFFVCASLVALTQLNKFAAVSRLRTLAMAIALQKADAIMTVPWGVASATPLLLTAGTTTENSLPLDNDAFNAQAGLGSPFSGLDLQTAATRVTTISSLTARTVRAAITVSYDYRGKTYTVSLTTIRATDTI